MRQGERPRREVGEGKSRNSRIFSRTIGRAIPQGGTAAERLSKYCPSRAPPSPARVGPRGARGGGRITPVVMARLKPRPSLLIDPVSSLADRWSAGAATVPALQRRASPSNGLSPGRASPSLPGEEPTRRHAGVGAEPIRDRRSKHQFHGHPQPALPAAARQLPAEVQRRSDNPKSGARPGSSRITEMRRVRQTELLRPQL